jgi:hypothetical protein
MVATLGQNPFCVQTVGTGEVVGGRNERAVVPIDRKRLAEADYGRVDFKRGIRNDRRQRAP